MVGYMPFIDLKWLLAWIGIGSGPQYVITGLRSA